MHQASTSNNCGNSLPSTRMPFGMPTGTVDDTPTTAELEQAPYWYIGPAMLRDAEFNRCVKRHHPKHVELVFRHVADAGRSLHSVCGGDDEAMTFTEAAHVTANPDMPNAGINALIDALGGTDNDEPPFPQLPKCLENNHPELANAADGADEWARVQLPPTRELMRLWNQAAADLAGEIARDKSPEAFKLAAELTAPSGGQVNQVASKLLSTLLQEDRPPLNMLIDDVLVASQSMLVAGTSKAMKTAVLCDMVVSLGTGTRFLDRFNVNGCHRVLFISTESGEDRLYSRCQVICRERRVEPDALDTVAIVDTPFPIGTPAGNDELLRLIREHQAAVVVVDPAYQNLGKAIGEGSSNVNIAGAILSELQQLVREENATLIIAHHTVKSAGATWLPLEHRDITGAGYGEWMRQWILLNRRAPYEPGVPHELWANIGGSQGHGSAWELDINEGIIDLRDNANERWIVTMRTAVAARRDEKENKNVQRAAESEAKTLNAANEILVMLTTRGGHQETRSRVEKTTTPTTACRTAADRLVQLGLLSAVQIDMGRGRYPTVDGYQLTTSGLEYATQYHQQLGTDEPLTLPPGWERYARQSPITMGSRPERCG